MPMTALKGLKAIISTPRKVHTENSSGVDTAFEALLDGQDVPKELRTKLMTVDASIKQAFISSSTATAPTRKRGLIPPKKHQRHRSINFLRSEPASASKITIPELLFEEPGQFVQYLTVTSPRDTNDACVHRLNMFLRSQPTVWVNLYIALGGFKALADQVDGIIKIEWREEHEDELLSELLACVQSLCTVRTGVEQLNAEYLRKITNLLFSDKQPSDFTCRGRIISILEIYIGARGELRQTRALEVLDYLADPVKPLSERPLEMLEKARKSRPYKRWVHEIRKLTQDCFWAFLHTDNKIPILSPAECAAMPKRKPVVPEGYVGGVEWLVIEYICFHLSLLNTILSSLPITDRQSIRTDMKNSSFETTCGTQLRRASTTFFVSLTHTIKQQNIELTVSRSAYMKN